jgi:excisionase family DNA binding protein
MSMSVVRPPPHRTTGSTPVNALARSDEHAIVTDRNAIVAKPFYSVAEVADLLGVNKRTIRRWIDQGNLVAHRFGRQLRISRADLETFVRLRREG